MKKNIFFININEKILILFLILFSLLINQYYGNKGVLPMDSFFVFDSGYYVLNDIHPFKDYWSITGPTLDYLQALFFLIFGTNWFGYVLHASIVNLVLTVFSYLVFVNLGLNKIYSFIYSLGIALLAYPNIGVPFVDHHSTIFSVLAIYCFILGIKKENNFFWFFIPLLLGLSFFSKQIPAAYIIILLTATSFFYFFYKFNKKNIYFLLAGISFTILFFSFFFIINEIPFNNFLIQYIFYPLSLGNQRYENLNISFNSVVEQFKFIYLCLIPMILVLIKILRKNIKKKLENIDALVIFSVIVATLIFIYTQLLTSNQILIFFLIPIVTAFSHIYFSKYHKKKYFLYLIILICIFSVTKYHLRFNEQKKFMELENINLELAIDAGKIHKMFSGLDWITHHYPNNPSNEIENLVNIIELLRSDTSNKIIISDYLFLYALLDLKFNSPNKWYDDKTIPKINNKYFPHYKDFFMEKLKKSNVSSVYLIGDYNSPYFENVFQDKTCMQSKRINEMLIIYNITDCKL